MPAEPRRGDTVRIERREALVTRVDRTRRTLDAELTRKADPVLYVGRPWARVEIKGE